MNTIVTKITSQIASAQKDPFIVGIAGGSASGKSLLSTELKKALTKKGVDCKILHQDDFAIGKEFKDKHTSMYKWDDPENFRLDKALDIAESVLAGGKEDFTAYELSTHKPSFSKTLSFSPDNTPKVLIVEGLFAWTHGFEKIVDLKVFVKTNFVHSYALRLNRNVLVNKNANFETVTRQYFTHVARAYHDLVLPLGESADIVFDNGFDLNQLEPPKQLTIEEELKDAQTVFSDAALTIRLGDEGEAKVIEISNSKGMLFREPLSQDLSTQLLKQISISKYTRGDGYDVRGAEGADFPV